MDDSDCNGMVNEGLCSFSFFGIVVVFESS